MPKKSVTQPTHEASTKASHNREGLRPRKQRAMTRQQIKFAHYVVSGLPLTESYLRAYKGKDALAQGSQWNNASRTAKIPQVAALIDQLRSEAAAQAAADRAEKLRILETQLRDPDMPARERREAIKLHNEMTGDSAPIKHEVSHSLDLHALGRTHQ